MIYLPICRDNHIFGRHGRGNCLIPADEGVAFSCRVGRGGNRRAVVLCNGCNGTAACCIKGDCILIYHPLRRDSHILRRHSRGNFLIPAEEGVAFSCRVGRGGNRCAVVLCNGCNGTTTYGVEGDGILIDLPLRPVFLVARFGVADCRNRRAGQIFAVIPALEGVPGARHICRECCTHAVGIFSDIAAVDSAVARVQRDGIGRGCPLHRQFRHISRNTGTGGVGIAIAVKPHEVAACIFVRAGQTAGCRRGKLAAVFHDDVNSIEAAAQLAAAKVEGNGFQPVSAQRAGVRDFKDGAEAEGDVPTRGREVTPEAGRMVPANRRDRRGISILPPRNYFIPVLDISVVLVQYRVPFIICRRAALGIVPTCRVTSHRRCAQGIAHAAAGIIFAENQTFVIQAIPAYRMRYGIVRHKQAVGIFVVLCILLGGFHRCCKLVCVHCPGIGKGNIVERRVRQTAVCRSGDVCAGEVKIIFVAGLEGKLL